MLIALFVYMLVGLSLEDKIDLSVDKSVINILRYIFYFLSGVLVFSIKYVRKFILNSKSENEKNGYSENPAVFIYIKATITSLAIAEFVAVLGLVLFILGKNKVDLYLLVFISAISMIIYRPFKEQMVHFARDFGRTD
jgi:ABC-type xylose transport system permease subunit